MKRYHTTIGTGDGIEAGIMREITDYPGGHWVKYDDAVQELEAAHKNGVAEGIATSPTLTSLEEAFDKGRRAAHYDLAQQVKAAPVLTSDADDRRRLLNELYHDRARLERAVMDAAHLMRRTIEYARTYNWKDADGESVVNDYPLIGSLEQFADTHGE